MRTRMETDALLEALADYVSASSQLRAKLDDYDGYSPSYYLANDIALRAAAAERFERAFDEAVRAVPVVTP